MYGIYIIHIIILSDIYINEFKSNDQTTEGRGKNYFIKNTKIHLQIVT